MQHLGARRGDLFERYIIKTCVYVFARVLYVNLHEYIHIYPGNNNESVICNQGRLLLKVKRARVHPSLYLQILEGNIRKVTILHFSLVLI